MCICNKKNQASNPNDLQCFLYAYFTHTNILKVTVNYLATPNFTSGVKYCVENEHFIDENTKKRIEAFWSHGGPPAFNKKDDTSGQFFIFAAFVESQFIKKVKS